MSKKHFIALADLIRLHNSPANGLTPFTEPQIDSLAQFCKDQNPQFDWDRWTDYIAGRCGSSGGKVKQTVCA